MTRITKIAMSGFTALALAVTPMQVQAAPDAADIAKTIAGIAIIGAIANASNNRTSSNPSPVQSLATRHRNSIEGTRIIDGRLDRNPARSDRVRHRILATPIPARCERFLTTNRGTRSVYAARCLSRHYAYADRLPENCKLKVRTGNDRIRSVYGARCLRRNGWQLAQN